MAGIYIHIPFCKSRCAYCGFYSTTRQDLRQRYVDAVCRELELRAYYIKKERVNTIYIGGGTPSQLSSAQLQQLFWATGTADEVTIECNPDDVTEEFARLLAQLPVNRVSMGAQTFSNSQLRFIGRRHTAEQVPAAIKRLRDVGIKNISIDLMYGFPGETIEDWRNDIDTALGLGAEHLSAYALMYEEGTPLYRMLEAGQIAETDEELSLQMYELLIDCLTTAGYEHYEISNFARKGFRSRHNSSYWQQVPYLGVGAAAHSYDGHNSRQWNVADVEAYIEGMEKNNPVYEREELSSDTIYNELVMTSLRTCEGLDTSKLAPPFLDYCMQQAQRFIDGGLLSLHNRRLCLTRKGLFVSNMVMSELMRV